MFIFTFYKLYVDAFPPLVGAVIGFAVVSRGVHSVKWSGLGYIAIGWVARFFPCILIDP